MKENKGFVWYGLRISFYLLLACYFVIGIYIMTTTKISYSSGLVYLITSILPYLSLIALIFTFVLSILHLKKYKKKKFAITSLVVSSIVLVYTSIILLLGFFY